MQTRTLGLALAGILTAGIAVASDLPAPAVVHMVVQRQVGSVEFSPAEPAVQAVLILIEDLFGFLEPIDEVHALAPEKSGILNGQGVQILVSQGVSSFLEASRKPFSGFQYHRTVGEMSFQRKSYHQRGSSMLILKYEGWMS